MRCVVFPSVSYLDGSRPTFESFLEDAEVKVVYGPTQSGLYLLEGSMVEMELLKFLITPYYILFEDFESPTIH